MGPASTILPGLRMPAGSNVRLIVAEGVVDRRPEHLAHERAAHQAVAVLARQRAAELEHQVGAGVGDGLELPHARLGLQVDHRPHVQAADRGVGVDAGRGAVRADQCQEALDVVAQPLGRHRRVLDERDRLGVLLHRHRQAQAGLAQAPDARLGGQVGGVVEVIAEAVRPQVLFHARACAAAGPRRDRRRTPRTAAPRDRRR